MLNDSEYLDILINTRIMLKKSGFSNLDDRIISEVGKHINYSEIKKEEKPFYEVIFYLKLLISEISLGSNEQIKSILRRIHQTVETESGKMIEGIDIQITQEESKIYGIKSLKFGPDKEIQTIVDELKLILDDLFVDRNGDKIIERKND